MGEDKDCVTGDNINVDVSDEAIVYVTQDDSSGDVDKQDSKQLIDVTESENDTLNPSTSSTSEELMNNSETADKLSEKSIYPLRPGITWCLGGRLEACDVYDKWYPARIVEIDDEDLSVCIHFEGWNARYDEWFLMSDDRLRPSARHSVRDGKGGPQKKGSKITTDHKVGDCVFAKWTDCRHYAARIISVNKNGPYDVVYFDGFRKTVQPINIKPMPDSVQTEYNNMGLLPPPLKQLKSRTAGSNSSRSRSRDGDNSKRKGTRKRSTDKFKRSAKGKFVSENRKNDHISVDSTLPNSSSVTSSNIKIEDSEPIMDVKQLMMFNCCPSDDDWPEKAVAFLVKKLKKLGCSITSLERALRLASPDTECVTIPRSLDGRLQVCQDHRRERPHVIYCRIWRWPDLENHFELAPVDNCKKPFSAKQLEEVCINPYHYMRIFNPVPGKSRVKNIPNKDHTDSVATHVDPLVPLSVKTSEAPGIVIKKELLSPSEIKTESQTFEPPEDMVDMAMPESSQLLTTIKTEKDISESSMESSQSNKPDTNLLINQSTESSLSVLDDQKYKFDVNLNHNYPHHSKVPAPKEFKISDDHNQYKCPFESCYKAFRKMSLLEYHIKYYHPPENKSTPAPQRKRRKTISSCSNDSDISVCTVTSKSGKKTRREILSQSSALNDTFIDSGAMYNLIDNSLNILDESHSSYIYESDLNDSKYAQEETMEALVEANTFGSVSQESSEIINCICQLPDENGLMIQCEVCLCWQHAQCMELSEDTLPRHYVCYICSNPPGVRESCRFLSNQEWHRDGTLPLFTFLPPPPDADTQPSITQAIHSLVADALNVKEVLHGMRCKLTALEDKDHTEYKLWTKNWDRVIERNRDEQLLELERRRDGDYSHNDHDLSHFISSKNRTDKVTFFLDEVIDTKNNVTEHLPKKKIDPELRKIMENRFLTQRRLEQLDIENSGNDSSESTISTDSPPIESCSEYSDILIGERETDDKKNHLSTSSSATDLHDYSISAVKESNLKANKMTTFNCIEDLESDVSFAPGEDDTFSNCEKNLLEHIMNTHDRVNERLDSLEAQISALEILEPSANNSKDVLDDIPGMKKSIHSLMSDLIKVKRMSRFH